MILHRRSVNVPVDFVSEVKKGDTSMNNKEDFSSEKIIAQAFKFHAEGNIHEAAKYYQICIDQNHKDPRVFSNLGVIFKQIGKFDRAMALYKKGVSLYPSDPDLNSNLGNLLCDMGEIKEVTGKTTSSGIFLTSKSKSEYKLMELVYTSKHELYYMWWTINRKSLVVRKFIL